MTNKYKEHVRSIVGYNLYSQQSDRNAYCCLLSYNYRSLINYSGFRISKSLVRVHTLKVEKKEECSKQLPNLDRLFHSTYSDSCTSGFEFQARMVAGHTHPGPERHAVAGAA